MAGSVSNTGGEDAGSSSGAAAAGGNESTGGTASTGGEAGETGLGGAPSVEPIAHCAEIRFLAEPPMIDGALDPGMYLEALTPLGWKSPDMLPLPPGTNGKFSVGWRPDGLYFYAEITDPDRNPAPDGERSWQGDGFELYIDHDASFDTPPPGFDMAGTRQFILKAPADDTNPAALSEIRVQPSVYEAWEAGAWRSIPTSDGYVVEAFVEAEHLGLPSWSLSSGDEVGFDLAHNVSYAPGTTGEHLNRLGQYFLRILDPPLGDDNDYPFNNEAAFCTATLL